MRTPEGAARVAAALLVLVALTASADEVTVNSITAAHQAGSSAADIVAMVNLPTASIAMTAGDLVTLRSAGVPEEVIAAVWAHIPAPTRAPTPLQPDDSRLVDLVRLSEAGVSEPVVAEQVRQSGGAYSLSVNDLLYLKQNGIRESTIVALMATVTASGAAAALPPVAPSSDLVFEDLVVVSSSLWFWETTRHGRLLIVGDGFRWEDRDDPEQSFDFQTPGLEKVWFSCDQRTPENFCYQVNFKIVKGDLYRFRDSQRDAGSNAAVVKLMDAVRAAFPNLTVAAPDVAD